MRKKINLFLDFDGVLFNTIKEAYILCRYAYSGVDYFKNIDEKEYRSFYRYKFLVYNSWQYLYIMRNLSKGFSDKIFISEYTEALNNRDLTKEKEFDKKYYYGRNDLMQNYHDYWDKLEQPFDFFYEVKKLYESGKADVVIVSKKNKQSILYRLNQYGLNLSENKIVGKEELEGYASKAEYIEEYMNKNKIKESYFVDDNTNNLKPCEKYSKICPMLADWGNIGIDEVGLSLKQIKEIILS